MLKRDITQLAIYQIEEEVEILPLKCLRSLYLEKTSEIVYIIKGRKLYGIVCLGDVLHCSQDGEVRVNKNFTALTGYNVIKAHEIFQKKNNIHKIPVVNESGELIGDYSRWDDILYVERNQAQLMQEETVKKVLEPYNAVYVIEPVEKMDSVYLKLKDYFEYFQLRYTVLNKEQIAEKLEEKSICIFLNEEERRGVQCLYGIKLLGVDGYRYDIPADIHWKLRLATYKSLLIQIIENTQLERLKIEKPDNLAFYRVDDRATILLSALKKEGIKCFCMYCDEKELTEFGKNFQNKVMERERRRREPVNCEAMWPRRVDNEAFYGELYQLEDYENEIAQKEIYQAMCSFDYKRNINGKYFNARDGRRTTCFQPEEYIGTIYLLGPCTIIGVFVEDQYTIASFLQKKLLEKGYTYRVENCGAIWHSDSKIHRRLQEISSFYENDIVIYLSMIGETVGIQGCSLERIYEKNRISSDWVTDGYLHCNHKANCLVADSMLEMIETSLSNNVIEDNKYEGIKIDIHNIMKDYVHRKYLSRYFSHFSGKEYATVGAIVMNCNPFSKGHRYLIEQARQQVEFLVVFVVEEDESLFPFEERFRLVVDGTKDLSNIMVVPSGDFILSRNNFKEYFIKEDDGAAACNAEYDINIFADYIADPLHITHRFAGEEPEDKVTGIYNEVMRSVLPSKGIAFVEIPRIAVEDEIVSASRIRKYLESEEYDKAFALLPETSKRYLMSQTGIKIFASI